VAKLAGDQEPECMHDSPLCRLPELGQSPWLDFIRRGLLESGELRRMIEDWGIRGMTSNPVIFESAIAGSAEYDADIARLARSGAGAGQIYESLAIDDVQRATDLFRDVHDTSDGADGFVSLEVSPHLARDTEATIAEARRLWMRLDRPNAMIKVPGTTAGLPAIRRLLADGININVTLLFSLDGYRQVLGAWLDGLETALAEGRRIDRIASVASFFLSRIDTLLDRRLDEIAGRDRSCADSAAALRGQIAIASARCAYGIFTETIASERFRHLATHGARPQRLLWASTGTKNPAYSDLKYVEPLIGPGTVNTMPLETLRAYHDHGRPEARLAGRAAEGERVLAALARIGVDLGQATGELLEEGISKFVLPYDALLQSLENARERVLKAGA
jgi:transaldolase